MTLVVLGHPLIEVSCSTMNEILNAKFANLRSNVFQIFDDLAQISTQIRHEQLLKTVNDLISRLHDPFMFVIVGEIKAGKSSFVNALLDTPKDICKVGPAPETDTIQQVIYGEKEKETVINPHFKIIEQPVDILQEIAIVDTPGTNAIIEHHQEITERFVPVSDLIVFVFEAKNPYRQSAWQFFDFIHTEWRKKIIFILQQKDLMAVEELQTNLQGLRDQARKKGIEEAVIFAVSAKLEREGQKEESGFIEVRQFIREEITGGKIPLLKLNSHLDTAKQVVGKISHGLQDRVNQNEKDIDFRKEITETLEQQQGYSTKQVDILTENLLASYDHISKEKEGELKGGLAFGKIIRKSISAMFNQNASIKVWLEDFVEGLERDFNLQLKEKVNDRILDLAQSVQQMATVVDLKIRGSESHLKDDHELFSHIAEKRNQVVRELSTTFGNFLADAENFHDRDLFPDSNEISPNVATGGGLAIIGVVLAAVTSGMVLDITGGILTTLGVLFAGFTLGWQRRKIIRHYRTEMTKGRDRLAQEISGKLKTYVKHLRGRIDQHFAPFDELIKEEESALAQLQSQITAVSNEIASKRDEVDDYLGKASS